MSRLATSGPPGQDALVHVVLATHNGARFLAEQIESILAQDSVAFNLLVMDDRSDDDSPAIVSRYARGDARVQPLQRPADLPHGAGPSFAYLLQAAVDRGARYVLCADQDDCWSQEKIPSMLDALRSAEGTPVMPALVHHDLEVVDDRLRPLSRSFWSYMGLAPGTELRPQRLLSRNEVTGCALACNRALLEQALPIPREAIMHDWWLALCAAFLGRLRPLDQRLVRYRQHGANAIGAKSLWHGMNPFTNWREGWQRGNEEFRATVAQARAFLELMGPRLDASGGELLALQRYCSLPSLGRGQRVKAMRACGLWREQWLLNSVLVLRLWLLSEGER